MRWRWAVLLVLVAVSAAGCRAEAGAPGKPPPGRGGSAPASMVAIGDSLTSAFGSCLAPAPCPRNSWATGDGPNVNSHYKRIVAIKPAMSGHATNLADPGATSADLPGQARAAVGTGAEYVTVLIGANDACRHSVDEMTTASTYRARVEEALGIVKKGLPNARVLLVSMPNLYHLWEIGHTNGAAARVWSLGVCPSLLANPTSTAAADTQRRAKVRTRVEDFNRELSRVCFGYGLKCRYDGGAVFRFPFALNQVTPTDFLHPNTSGQNELARVTYAAGFSW